MERSEAADHPYRTALLMMLLCMGVYLSNGRTAPVHRSGDTVPNRLIPFAILRYGVITLDVFRDDFARAGVRTWYLRESRGKLVSFYPVGAPLAALPFYVPYYGYLSRNGLPEATTLFHASQTAEKLAASSMTAIAVGLFYLTARRRLLPRQAFRAALAFGFGSLMWASASQSLWQQTVVAVCVTIALWAVTTPALPAWAAATAGAALGLAVATRPSAVLFLIAGFVSTLVIGASMQRWLKVALWFAAAAAPFVVFGLGVNWYFHGSFSGAYSAYLSQLFIDIVTLRRVEGIAGLLVSPNRGLLIYTPLAVFGLWGLLRQPVLRGQRDPVLLAFGAAALVHLVMYGSYDQWYGGFTFGPRYLIDILPVLAIGGVSLWNDLPRWVRRFAIPVLVWCVLVQMSGSFCYPASRWSLRNHSAWESAVWDWSQFEPWQDFRVWLRNDHWATPM